MARSLAVWLMGGNVPLGVVDRHYDVTSEWKAEETMATQTRKRATGSPALQARVSQVEARVEELAHRVTYQATEWNRLSEALAQLRAKLDEPGIE